MSEQLSREQAWPPLPLDAWAESCATLHMWTQIVGKIRLRESAPINHGWHSTLYVTARGLTTSPMPHGLRTFQIDFDFIDHVLVIEVSDGRTARVALEPQTVASFYRRVMDALRGLDIDVRIYARPNEVPDPIPFDRDEVHRAYDAEAVNRFWRVLVQSDRVFKQFRSGFIGKCSPVHFFWGAPDLAVTRFSGRTAPEHPGGIPNLPDRVTREAYSHEVSSAGFWAGGGRDRVSRVLRLRVSRAGRVRGRRGRGRARRSTARISTSSSCPTTPCGRRPTPTARCSSSSSRLTSRRRISASGIARRSSHRSA